MKSANGDSQQRQGIPWTPIVIVILVVSLFSAGIIVSPFIIPLFVDFEHPETAADNYDRWRYSVLQVPDQLNNQWSPGGSHILFTAPALRSLRLDSAKMQTDLYGLRLEDRRLRKIAENAHWPSTSPDDSRVAYSSTRDPLILPLFIETSELDGSNRQRLTEEALKNVNALTSDPLRSDVAPAWSPDGERIAFARIARPGGEGIYVMNSDGTGQHLIYRFRQGESTQDVASDNYGAGPVWSPDGQRLAFVVNEFTTDSVYDSVNRFVLYVVNFDGSGLVRAYETTLMKSKLPVGFSLPKTVWIDKIFGQPAWSPDGLMLAFGRYISFQYYEHFYAGEELSGPSGAILNIVTADGTGLRTTAELDKNVPMQSVSWSPSRSDILLPAGNINAEGDIYIANAKDGSYSYVAKGSHASWSPDGSRIAVINTYAVPDFNDPIPTTKQGGSLGESGNRVTGSSDAYLFTVASDGSGRKVLVVVEDDGDLKAAR